MAGGSSVSARQTGSEQYKTHSEPHIVALPRTGCELDLSLAGANHNAVLVKTGRERIRVEDLTNSFDVRWSAKIGQTCFDGSLDCAHNAPDLEKA